MSRSVATAFLIATALVSSAFAQPQVLDYIARYTCQSDGPDHIMNAIAVPGGRAIVATNLGLTLIDLDNLPPDGTQSYLDRLTGLNARDLYDGGGGIYYVNLHRQGTAMSAGLAVVRLVGNDLQTVTTLGEDGLLMEKMCVNDGHLYVAAHSAGLRVYSLADPHAPSLVGMLTDSLVDAFDVEVFGTTAYVADGAGGLKIVDIGNPTAPTLIAGETTETALGTAEHVTVRNGDVFVALGGAGVGFYSGGDPTQRVVVAVDGCAESLCWLGDNLAVGTLTGVEVFDVSGPAPALVATEVAARRGAQARLRICSDVSAAGQRVLCSDWNWLDVYELRDAAVGDQADITASHQRIRFAPTPGVEQVTIRNDGALPLIITSVAASAGAFHCDYTGGTIASGESVTCQISYDGTGTNAAGTVVFQSNDPDESLLPIQVFGNTLYLDPGEPAADFTLPALTHDPDTGVFTEDSFTLSGQLGKVVWFQVFGTW